MGLGLASSLPVPSALWSVVLLLHVLDFLIFAGEVFFFYIGFIAEMPHTPSEIVATVDDFASRPKLPVVRYECFRKRSVVECGGRGHICVICLVVLENEDVVTDLGNCNHAFHKGCIDQWIEVGQRICPLCRSLLVPAKRKKETFWLLSSLTKLGF